MNVMLAQCNSDLHHRCLLMIAKNKACCGASCVQRAELLSLLKLCAVLLSQLDQRQWAMPSIFLDRVPSKATSSFSSRSKHSSTSRRRDAKCCILLQYSVANGETTETNDRDRFFIACRVVYIQVFPRGVFLGNNCPW